MVPGRLLRALRLRRVNGVHYPTKAIAVRLAIRRFILAMDGIILGGVPGHVRTLYPIRHLPRCLVAPKRGVELVRTLHVPFRGI